MHMTADDVEEGCVLYELHCCIALKIFVAWSDLELQGIHKSAGAIF